MGLSIAVGLLGAAQSAYADSPSVTCASLAGASITAADIGLPTTGATVTLAKLVLANASGNTNGEYCLVTAAIHPVDPTAPNILMQVNLPTSWNGRALQMGGGGYNGSVVTGLGTAPGGTVPPLSQGYVTFGGDSGHEGGGAGFARNQEALVNYGYASLKKTHDVALKLVKTYYSESPQHMYFAGFSTGGRETLTVAQRFPQDYDGVLAGSPTANFTMLRMVGQIIGRPEYNVPGGFVNRNKQLRVVNAALAACDALDGISDGIIANVKACRAVSAQTLASLRCPGGVDTGDTCLSDPQLAVIQAAHSGYQIPYQLADGVDSYAGYNVLEGTGLSGSFNFGTSATVLVPPTNAANGYLFAMGDDWLKNFITMDSSFNSLNFDPLNPGQWEQTIVEQSNIVGATNPDLLAYVQRGGKLILSHGTEDMAIATNNSLYYYNSVVGLLGQRWVDSFFRFYTIAGFGHGQGAFNATYDGLGALDAWVTQGVAPGNLVTKDANSATAGRARPMCVSPGWPQYVAGDPNAASSFQCADGRVPFAGAPFAGVPGAANCNGRSTSALATEFGGLPNAVQSLGFANLQNLKSAITAFCGR
jgi:feruloyl esterase